MDHRELFPVVVKAVSVPLAMWLRTLRASCEQPTSNPPLGRFSNNNLIAGPGYLL